MATPIVQISHISKTYGEQPVLRDISFNLDAGKFYALLGKNGAGKSTLLRILMRTELPTSGTGRILGRSIDEDCGDLNQSIGYVSENIDYAFPMSVQQLFSRFNGLYKNWNQSSFENVLQNLKFDSSKSFKQLSRGQKMQVAFAAALAIQPKIVLLDEITAVLDANARSYFMRYLGQFVKGGGTVLMATNIVSEVQHYADHLIFIDDSHIKLDLPIKQISEKFCKLRKQTNTTHPVFDDENCIEVTLNSDNSTSFMIPQDKIGRYKILPELMDKRGITAEEIFIYYTRGKLR